jgi:hypothetical protein
MPYVAQGMAFKGWTLGNRNESKAQNVLDILQFCRTHGVEILWIRNYILDGVCVMTLFDKLNS